MAKIGNNFVFVAVIRTPTLLPLPEGRSRESRWVSLLLKRAEKVLVRVAGGDIARDLGAFFQIAVDDDVGGRRAAAIGLLKAAIAAIETCHHLVAAVAARRFGVDQRLRLVAPFLAFIAVANAAQEMERAKDLRQALQVVIIGGGFVLQGRRGRRRGLRRQFGRGRRDGPRRLPVWRTPTATAPTAPAPTAPAPTAPAIAPELRLRWRGGEPQRERNAGSDARYEHGLHHNQGATHSKPHPRPMEPVQASRSCRSARARDAFGGGGNDLRKPVGRLAPGQRVRFKPVRFGEFLA